MWCASGQTPQMRAVRLGMSSTTRPDAEFLEAAQFGDLQVGVGHVALVVQKDVDLAVTFQPRDGIDGNAFHGLRPSTRNFESPCYIFAGRRLTAWATPRALA
jgi:hypothetical protein